MENNFANPFAVMTDGKITVAVSADITVGGADLRALIAKEDDGFSFSGETVSPLDPYAWIKAVAASEDIPLPDLDFPKVKLSFLYKGGIINAAFSFTKFINALSFYKSDGIFAAEIKLDDYKLSSLPFFGSYLKNFDAGIKGTKAFYASLAAGKTFEADGVKIQNGVSFYTDFCGIPISYEPAAAKTLSIRERNVNALTDAETSDNVKWFDINKTFSVITLIRAGVSFSGETAAIKLDVKAAIAAFTLTVYGAQLSIDLKTKKFGGGIDGLGLGYRSGSIEISGMFARTDTAEYTGMLSIHLSKFGLDAIASYNDSDKSFFAYACLSYNFGGPPVFFVTGLSLGFGINKCLLLPGIDGVEAFPLVNGVINGGFSDKDIDNLKNIIQGSDGDYFIAAGVRFTSFGIINSFALLTVSFGNDTQIAVMGISKLLMPPNTGSTPIAQAKLAILITIDVKAGEVKALAQLTDDSYVFSRDCKLTGGFAFYTWFSGEHSGDFVLTLGGYHPDYKKPSHYPDVPRLGFNWQITGNLSFSGDIYFALTPSAVMAGGRLSAVYKSGGLRAWFTAQVDMFMQWKPFHYEFSASVSVGASYSCFLGTYRTELGVSLSVRGPDFSGEAHIKWFIISFTISFGSYTPPPPLTWSEFCATFLTQKDSKTAPLSFSYKGTAIADPTSNAVINRNAVLNRNADNDSDRKIYRADNFSITVTSQIPEGNTTSVFPMNCADLKSVLSSAVIGADKTAVEFTATPVKENLPRAMWGTQNEKGELVTDINANLITFPEKLGTVFPENEWLSEQKLRKAAMLHYYKVFSFYDTPEPIRNYKFDETIPVFTKTFKQPFFAKNADNLFDEDIILISV
jgi:hypothetical protein